MGTVADRIRWILTDLQISERELGRRAGKDGAQISLLLKRLDETDPEGVTLRTLREIAEGAKVSLAWLAANAGGPRPEVSADLIPARTEAAQMARDADIWPEAIRGVCAEPVSEVEAARSVDWWLKRMELREIEMIDEALRRREAREQRRGSEQKPTDRPPSQAPRTVPAESGISRKPRGRDEGVASPTSTLRPPSTVQIKNEGPPPSAAEATKPKTRR